jgi:hypothetical protein
VSLQGDSAVNGEPWQQLLCDALVVLSLPAEEQILVNGPGCVACDIDSDFDHAQLVAMGHASSLTNEQRALLDRIEEKLRSQQPQDYECFNPDVLRRPVWQELRVLAAEALWAFGWEREKVSPFVEVEPGVWQRTPSKVYFVRSRIERGNEVV